MITTDDKIEYPPIFQYKDIEIPKDAHKISPSQIAKFFEYPKLYYQENVMNAKSEFQGNTATTLGTICHYIYHCVITDKKITREEIDEQLNEYSSMKPELDLDVNDIITNYPKISEIVVNDYILKSKATLKESEKSVLVEIGDNIYLGGTTDLIEGSMIVDFKTVGSKPDTEQIPFKYKIQLLAYAYAFRKKGYEIDRVRIVYGVKPTKTLPARCFIVTEQIDFVADKLINDTIKLIAESVTICRNQPELIPLIFKSFDLRK